MHMFFSNDEKRWINTDRFGWPIKRGCPDKIKKVILKKKNIIDNQMEARHGNDRNQES